MELRNITKPILGAVAVLYGLATWAAYASENILNLSAQPQDIAAKVLEYEPKEVRPHRVNPLGPIDGVEHTITEFPYLERTLENDTRRNIITIKPEEIRYVDVNPTEWSEGDSIIYVINDKGPNGKEVRLVFRDGLTEGTNKSFQLDENGMWIDLEKISDERFLEAFRKYRFIVDFMLGQELDNK